MGDSHMSGYRFARYKRSREERENDFNARCVRYWSHRRVSQFADGANASHASCPCDPTWPENPDQPAGCEYLTYEELPEKPIPRGKYDDEVDFALALLGVFLVVCLIFIYRKYRRDERARVFDEQIDIKMRARVEEAKRRAEHSGRSFVAVRQPTGELELAEVVVVKVVAGVASLDAATDGEREEHRAENARTTRRDASDDETRGGTGDEESATVNQPRRSPAETDDANGASRER